MHVRKNHVINLIGWLLIGLFLAYKSVLHTISTHDQGVSVAIREYRIQAQARISILKNSDFNAEGGYRSVYETHIFNEIDRIQNEMDPYAFIRKNDALTTYIDEYMTQIKFSSSDMIALQDVQQSMKQESLIFFSHAQAFNRLISRFPYSLLSKDYALVPVQDSVSMIGVIVER